MEKTWNELVSFLTQIWSYVEPYWTYINDFMGQTHTYNLWWFFGIVCVSFMMGRLTKRVTTKIEYRDRVQEKTVYKDKIVEKTVEVCPTNCILMTAQKLYQELEVDDLEFDSHDEQIEAMEARQKLMEYCIEEAKKLHQETKPN